MFKLAVQKLSHPRVASCHGGNTRAHVGTHTRTHTLKGLLELGLVTNHTQDVKGTER